MPLVKTGETAICHWCGQTIERDEDTDGKGPGRYDWDADGDYGCNDNPLTSPCVLSVRRSVRRGSRLQRVQSLARGRSMERSGSGGRGYRHVPRADRFALFQAVRAV